MTREKFVAEWLLATTKLMALKQNLDKTGILKLFHVRADLEDLILRAAKHYEETGVNSAKTLLPERYAPEMIDLLKKVSRRLKEREYVHEDSELIHEISVMLKLTSGEHA
jgi:hypothetical protein